MGYKSTIYFVLGAGFIFFVGIAGTTYAKGLVRVESAETPEIQRAAPIPWNSVRTSSVTTSSVRTSAVTVASVQTTASTNLIPNPSLEDSTTSGLPTSWAKGGYGTNTRTYAYPVSSHTGAKAAQVSITSYTSGDAKWFFQNVPVTGGQQYEFSDYSLGSVQSEIDVEYTLSDGTKKYDVIASVPANGSYTQTRASFTTPANAVSLTIFHLINRAGSLTIDDYSLTEVTATPPPPPPPSPPPPSSNLIPNGDLETAGSNGNPLSWARGGYGTNTRTFTYPASGVNGSKAAQITIGSYTSGDAKWYFTPVAVGAGTYTFTDEYQATVSSVLVAQFTNADGSVSYRDLATLPSTANFTKASASVVVPQGVSAITIFHLIKAVGSLTIDNASLTPIGAKSGGSIFQTGAVTLTFDDGWLSQYQNALPRMESKGFKGTFYIITRQLSDYGYTGYVSKVQIKDLYARGNEIGSHTQTHRALSTLTSAEQQQEIDGARQDLLAMQVGPINTFAYPLGDYDATTIQLVQNAGYTTARSTITGYTTPSWDHYQLPRQGITINTTVAQIEQWIDQAALDKTWLILVFHQIDPNGGTYNITPDNFGQVMDYLATKKIPVVTMEQGMHDLNPQ